MVFEENKNLIFLEAIELTCKISRKRPSPLQGGRTKTWVAAILNTIISILILEEVKEEEYSREKDLQRRERLKKYESKTIYRKI